MIHDALKNFAYERGYNLETFWLYEPSMTPLRLKQIFINRNIRGAIVCPLPGSSCELNFDFSEMAAVAIGHTLKSPDLDRVAVDYFEIVNIAIQKLRSPGHRRFAFFSDRYIDNRVNHRSRASYLCEWQEDPEHFVAPLIVQNMSTAAFTKWFSMHQPDAILAATRQEFNFVETWAEEVGLKIPQEFSLVCLDKLVDSPKSGVAQHLEQEARATISLLAGRVEHAEFGVPQFPQTILVSGIWQEGWSSWDRNAGISKTT